MSGHSILACGNRFGAVATVALVGFLLTLSTGCSKRGPGGESNTVEAPSQISDAQGEWVRAGGELVASDDQLIGQFFQQNPSLVGSPDWTGAPAKYELKGSPNSIRFYWFHGGADAAFWNAIDVSGSGFRELNGTGIPGSGQ